MSEIVKQDELKQLLAATSKANPPPAALAALRAYLVANPGACRAVGDLYLQAIRQIIDTAMPIDAGVDMSLRAHLGDLRAGLGSENASTMELMLIDHIAVCWLRLYVTEMRYEVNMKSATTIRQCRYWEDKLSTHQKRYLRAVEALARVRRLNVNVQVNIGQQQTINSGQTSAEPEKT